MHVVSFEVTGPKRFFLAWVLETRLSRRPWLQIFTRVSLAFYELSCLCQDQVPASGCLGVNLDDETGILRINSLQAGVLVSAR